ncbi:unnamed protein product [Choristocarpus tenellus]
MEGGSGGNIGGDGRPEQHTHTIINSIASEGPLRSISSPPFGGPVDFRNTGPLAHTNAAHHAPTGHPTHSSGMSAPQTTLNQSMVHSVTPVATNSPTTGRQACPLPISPPHQPQPSDAHAPASIAPPAVEPAFSQPAVYAQPSPEKGPFAGNQPPPTELLAPRMTTTDPLGLGSNSHVVQNAPPWSSAASVGAGVEVSSALNGPSASMPRSGVSLGGGVESSMPSMMVRPPPPPIPVAPPVTQEPQQLPMPALPPPPPGASPPFPVAALIPEPVTKDILTPKRDTLDDLVDDFLAPSTAIPPGPLELKVELGLLGAGGGWVEDLRRLAKLRAWDVFVSTTEGIMEAYAQGRAGEMSPSQVRKADAVKIKE